MTANKLPLSLLLILILLAPGCSHTTSHPVPDSASRRHPVIEQHTIFQGQSDNWQTAIFFVSHKKWKKDGSGSFRYQNIFSQDVTLRYRGTAPRPTGNIQWSYNSPVSSSSQTSQLDKNGILSGGHCGGTGLVLLRPESTVTFTINWNGKSETIVAQRFPQPTTTPENSIQPISGEVMHCSISPNGKFVACIAQDKGKAVRDLYVHYIITGTNKKLTPYSDDFLAYAVWSPNNAYLMLDYGSSADRSITIINTQEWDVITKFDSSGSPIWNRDGIYLAYGQPTSVIPPITALETAASSSLAIKAIPGGKTTILIKGTANELYFPDEFLENGDITYTRLTISPSQESHWVINPKNREKQQVAKEGGT